MNKEFDYGEVYYSGSRGKYSQQILFQRKQVGWLLYHEVSLLKFTETYCIPDVEYGIRDGWGDLKTFDNYDEAYSYVMQNLKEVVYIMKHADFD